MFRILSQSSRTRTLKPTYSKFMSRYTKAQPYVMVLYNEKPQSSFFVGKFHEHHQEICLPDVVKDIKNKSSKTLFTSDSNHVVLHTNSPIDIPVILKRVESDEMPTIAFFDIVKWLAKTPDSTNKDPGAPGTRIGRLDAANEAGFFHRADRSRLKNIKKTLKDKVEKEPVVPKKTE